MLRRKPQAAMVMTMKKTTSLNISVAESEAKLDASSCHPLVGGEATSTLMTRCLILAIYCRNWRITLFQKLSTHEAVKKSSTRIYQSTPYSSSHRISRSIYSDQTIIKERWISIKQGKPEEFVERSWVCETELSLWNGVFIQKSFWNGVFNLKSLWNGA